ncbi:hypothetical protein [Dokdonella soli]|uniref:Uncharacterized protein n=1 Tax=Dokdonella soli TaxID=529810 RepID=A0ABN1ID34_9GAMM
MYDQFATIAKAILSPAVKVFELLSAPRDDVPTLVQEPNGIDAGTPRWAREYSEKVRSFVRAEGTFFFKCTGGQCRYAELVSTKGIFTAITPNNFSEHDEVRITFDLDNYDKHVIFDEKPLVLKIRLTTGKGRRATLRLKCAGYRATPII